MPPKTPLKFRTAAPREPLGGLSRAINMRLRLWMAFGLLFWSLLASFWPHLGSILARLGLSFAHLGLNLGTTWKQAPCRNLGRPTCQKLLQHCPQLLHLAFQGNWPRTCQEHGKNQRQRTATCQLSSVMLPPRCDRQRKERPAPERGAAVLPPYGGFN